MSELKTWGDYLGELCHIIVVSQVKLKPDKGDERKIRSVRRSNCINATVTDVWPQRKPAENWHAANLVFSFLERSRLGEYLISLVKSNSPVILPTSWPGSMPMVPVIYKGLIRAMVCGDGYSYASCKLMRLGGLHKNIPKVDFIPFMGRTCYLLPEYTRLPLTPVDFTGFQLIHLGATKKYVHESKDEAYRDLYINRIFPQVIDIWTFIAAQGFVEAEFMYDADYNVLVFPSHTKGYRMNWLEDVPQPGNETYRTENYAEAKLSQDAIFIHLYNILHVEGIDINLQEKYNYVYPQEYPIPELRSKEEESPFGVKVVPDTTLRQIFTNLSGQKEDLFYTSMEIVTALRSQNISIPSDLSGIFDLFASNIHLFGYLRTPILEYHATLAQAARFRLMYRRGDLGLLTHYQENRAKAEGKLDGMEVVVESSIVSDQEHTLPFRVREIMHEDELDRQNAKIKRDEAKMIAAQVGASEYGLVTPDMAKTILDIEAKNNAEKFASKMCDPSRWKVTPSEEEFSTKFNEEKKFTMQGYGFNADEVIYVFRYTPLAEAAREIRANEIEDLTLFDKVDAGLTYDFLTGNLPPELFYAKLSANALRSLSFANSLLDWYENPRMRFMFNYNWELGTRFSQALVAIETNIWPHKTITEGESLSLD